MVVMVVMVVMGHLFCVPDTDHVKQKNDSLKTIPSRFSLNRKQRSLDLSHLCPVHEVLSRILESINTWTNCQFIWSGKVYIWLSVWEFEKLFLWLPMSQQGHACWELRNWSTSTWLVCEHFIQIHSCMGMCFSCMYTNNCEHFHKWFGTLYRDNSVLKRVLHIQ